MNTQKSKEQERVAVFIDGSNLHCFGLIKNADGTKLLIKSDLEKFQSKFKIHNSLGIRN